jgi:hypothetical protein
MFNALFGDKPVSFTRNRLKRYVTWSLRKSLGAERIYPPSETFYAHFITHDVCMFLPELLGCVSDRSLFLHTRDLRKKRNGDCRTDAEFTPTRLERFFDAVDAWVKKNT